MRVALSLVVVALSVPLVSCMDLPKPTAQEIAARDKWAAAVSPSARQQVMDDAARHTSWTEKRKVQYEIDRFQHVYKQEQARKARGGAGGGGGSTKPATRKASGATTSEA